MSWELAKMMLQKIQLQPTVCILDGLKFTTRNLRNLRRALTSSCYEYIMMFPTKAITLRMATWNETDKEADVRAGNAG